jgi:hypothetical protein
MQLNCVVGVCSCDCTFNPYKPNRRLRMASPPPPTVWAFAVTAARQDMVTREYSIMNESLKTLTEQQGLSVPSLVRHRACAASCSCLCVLCGIVFVLRIVDVGPQNREPVGNQAPTQFLNRFFLARLFFGLVRGGSRELPGGPRKSPTPRRMALGGLLGAPGAPGARANKSNNPCFLQCKRPGLHVAQRDW